MRSTYSDGEAKPGSAGPSRRSAKGSTETRPGSSADARTASSADPRDGSTEARIDSPEARSGSFGASSSDSALRAEFRVRRRRPSACPLVGDGKRTVESQELSCADADCGEAASGGPDGDERGFKCRTAIETDRGVEILGRYTDGDCVCPALLPHDCVSSVVAVEGDEFIISVTVARREELPAIVESLRSRGATVDLRRVARTDGSTPGGRISVDVNGVTDKQREALHAAFEEGYYERPRRADLGDLAERLDISRSAVSQRLTAVESTLVEALYMRESWIESTNR